jgi:hypothetical protein
VIAELKQLHDLEVIEPTDASKLSKEAKQAALEYLMFLKENRSGKIKGMGCANGRKQRIYAAKEDASSPTVAIEALMLPCVIDAKAGRKVGNVDVPGAFMQADQDELVHVRLQGKMSELLVQLDPELYRPYIQTEN